MNAKKSTDPVKRVKGRPPVYSMEDIARIKATIITYIPQGYTLRQVLKMDGMCSMSHLFRELLPNDAEFREQYARAFELRNEYWAEEMIEIADDSRNDWTTRSFGGVEVEVPDLEVVKRSQLRIETRKWLMGKSQPKKYGEKIGIEHSTDKEAPPVFTLKIDNG